MQGFMLMLLICSVTISALALFYMAITPLLAKRYSVMGRYYAWLVLVIGLIIPFRPNFNSAIVKVSMPINTTMPVIQIGNRAPVTVSAPISNSLNISWWQIAAAVWLVGIVIFVAYHGIKHYHFLKLAARWSENVTNKQMLTQIQNLKMQMGITKNIGLQFCDSIGSPMMIGFTNPRILLPKVNFSKDEIHFILMHELVHYKRKDLWYKALVLIATAIHWFNPIVYLMAKVIDIQCELSCDEEVVRGTDSDARQYYSETIIGVVRHKSKRKTALSTNFYGGKKGMKKRIFSIMDMKQKKAGTAVLCSVLILTLGTGAAFAANADMQNVEMIQSDTNVITPWLSVGFTPSPDIYAPYATFGITISKDGKKLLYKGQPVRQFVDEKVGGWAYYLDDAGNENLSVVRNVSGEITDIESISAQKAQEYFDAFFAEELDHNYPEKVYEEAVRDVVQELGPEALHKYNEYQRFGITYSEKDEVLYFNGQRVKFFIDLPSGEEPNTFWTDNAGTINLAVIRDTSGQITGVESISDEKVQGYQFAVNEYNRNISERIEAGVNE